MIDDRPPSELDADVTMRRLRWRMTIAMAVMFGVLMLVAGPLSLATGLPPYLRADQVVVLKLVILALVMPAIMVVAVGRVLEPAEDLAGSSRQLRDLYDQARLDALLDPLTALGNHRAFQEELERQVADARRTGDPLALTLLDLDDLKQVNDRLGHSRGDEVLAATGRLLGTSLRRSDRAFRIGGDEFAILMPRTDIETAFTIGRRLLAAALDAGRDPRSVQAVSFSAGVSSFPDPSFDGRRLYHHADAALYWCKRHGRTSIQRFDPTIHGATGDDRPAAELASAVADIASRRAMRPVYQPIFDLATGRPLGFEALVRPMDDSGFSAPEALFTAAESTGRTVELDFACLEVIAASVDLGPDLYLAVNFSPRTLESAEFSPTDVLARLGMHGVRPSQVVLEVTERESIEDLERLRYNLDACRAAGMRIAVDDVGAGNAGLRLLSQVEFDIVKIDLSLVQRGVLQESSLAVLRALGELAARWGSTIVAEGVETPEQLETIRDLGFPAAQGYLLGRPKESARVDAIDISALIAAGASTDTEVPSPRPRTRRSKPATT